MKVSKGTLIRTIVLGFALLNQSLTIAGKNPLPWSSAEIEQAAAMVLTTVASITAWWKNNSFTTAAIVGDQAKQGYKNGIIKTREM